MANQKIFSDQTLQYGGSFKAGNGHPIFFSPPCGSEFGFRITQTGLLVQQISIQAQRPLQTVYDLTTVYAYYVAQKAQVNMSLQKLVGPEAILGIFYVKFGDVCQGLDGNIWFDIGTDDCDVCEDNINRAVGNVPDGAKTLKVRNCALSSVGFSANVQSYQVNEDCQLAGLNVEIEDTASRSAPVARDGRNVTVQPMT
jgi:hypothetical protein